MFTQQYKMSADWLAFLAQSSTANKEAVLDTNFYFEDDFLGNSIDGYVWTFGAGASMFDDSVSGSIGTLKNTKASAGSNYVLTANSFSIGNADFVLAARVRVDAIGGVGSFFSIVLTDSGGPTFLTGFEANHDSPNWHAKVNGTNNSTSAVIDSVSYHMLVVSRVNGVLTFYYDGSLVYSTSSSAGTPLNSLYIAANAATSGTTTGYVDFIKLWIKR